MKRVGFKFIITAVGLSLAGLLVAGGEVAALGPYNTGSVGADVSWPNCTTFIPTQAFGIVGVTGGTVYSQNSCARAEASHYSNLSLYANTGWYSSSSYINPNSPKQCAADDQICLAYNYGYNAGVQAINYATASGLVSATWWLDVETMNTWSKDPLQNRSSIQGEYDGLASGGAQNIGVYSTSAEWNSITGNWLNNWPSWGATTWTTARQASTYCHGHEFTGGVSWLMQFKPRSPRLDQDVAC